MECEIERSEQHTADRLRAYELALSSAAAEFARPMELIEWNRCLLQQHMRLHGRDYCEQTVETALQDIHSAAAGMNRLVDHFTQLCACICGSVPVQQTGLDLASMLRSLCADGEAIYRAIGVQLVLEYDPGEVWYAVADPVLVERILLHLLSNGLRACSPGGKVVFRLGRRRGELVLTVQDDGSAMTAEQLQDAFSPRQLPLHQRVRTAGDTGLSLLLCGEYCRMLGWKTEITPQHKGVLISLVIPERREPLLHFTLHSPGMCPGAVSRIALLQELHAIPGLEHLKP